MKKIFTLFAVAAMAISANAQDGTPGADHGDLWLSATGTMDISAEMPDFAGEVISVQGWTFENGVKMWCLKEDKSYSGGNSNDTFGKPIKFSNGAYNQVILPEGFICDKIIFYGYCNTAGSTSAFQVYDSEKAAVYEGAIDVEGQFVPNVSRDDFKPMTLEDMPKVEAPLSKAVSGTFYFKNSGKQPAVFVQLVKGTEGAVNTIVTDENAPVEYFNLQGVKVSEPANGLYIKRQGSKVSKVVVK